MGFPDRIIVGRTEDQNAFPQGLNINERGAAFQQLSASGLMQLLAQLIDCRTYAQEIFTEIHEETMKTGARLAQVKERVQAIRQFVPAIQQTFHQTAPDCFHVPSSQKLVRGNKAAMGIFIRPKAPMSVNRRRADSHKMPDLDKFNQFSHALDLTTLKRENPNLEEATLRCSDKYSLPAFFYLQWVAAETEKRRIMEEQKKRRKEERKARRKAKRGGKKKRQDHKIRKIKKKYVDQFGNVYYKEVGGSSGPVEARQGLAQADRGNVQVVSKDYNRGNQQINQDLYQGTGNAGTFDINSQPPPVNKRHSQISMQPPRRSVHEVAMQPQSLPQPSPPQFSVAPPPVMHTGQHQHVAMPQPPGPPPMQQMQMPPTPVMPQQPATPPQPVFPDHMLPYKKMAKFGVGPAAIKNKMKANGDDPNDYDIYMGDGKGSGAPPAQRSNRPPSQPRPKMVIPTHAALRPTPQATKPKRGGGLLDAIRMGAKLKKSVDRPKPPPMAPTGRDAMLAAISGGRQLKKAEDRHIAAAEPEEPESNILAFLQLRVAITGDSSSEDDDSDWDEDSS